MAISTGRVRIAAACWIAATLSIPICPANSNAGGNYPDSKSAWENNDSGIAIDADKKK